MEAESIRARPNNHRPWCTYWLFTFIQICINAELKVYGVKTVMHICKCEHTNLPNSCAVIFKKNINFNVNSKAFYSFPSLVISADILLHLKHRAPFHEILNVWSPRRESFRTFLQKSNPREQCHLISNEFSILHQINRVSPPRARAGSLLVVMFQSQKTLKETMRCSFCRVPSSCNTFVYFPFKPISPRAKTKFIFYKTHGVTSSPLL